MKDSLPSYTVKVPTPDGDLFVHFVEENGKPVRVLINIGKAGTSISAWGDATARLITRLLPHVGIHSIIEELSGITSQRLTLTARGLSVRSGPEGLALALLRYREEKYREEKKPGRDGHASIGN